MSTNRRLGVAVLGGAGGIGRGSHLPAIDALPDVRLAAVADANEPGLAEVHEQYGVDTYTDINALLARDDVDIVDICTPDPLHAEHAIAAARAGKHVLCEKPLALELSDAVAMKRAAETAGVKIMCAMVNRWRRPFTDIKRLVDDGAIGRVVYAAYRGKGAFYRYPAGSVYYRAESKGQFIHNGPHMLDLLSWFADALPTRVYAVSRSHYVDPADRMATDNYTSATYRFESGAIGWVEQNLLMLNPRGFPTRTVYTVIGETGVVTYDSHAQSTILSYKGVSTTLESAVETVAPTAHAFQAEIRHLADCVRRDEPPGVPIDHSIRVLAGCLGALESAETGRTVELTEP